MNGPFGNRFPYTNFHEMNLNWMIQIAKDFLDQYTNIQDTIDTGLADLQTKYETLEGLLDAWYTEHSEDIADQLAGALDDLNTWYTTHEGYLDQYVTDSITAFGTAADAKAAETIASIPDDYTTLSNTVTEHGLAIGAISNTPLTWTLNKNVDGVGNIVTNNYTALTNRIPVFPGDVITRRGDLRDGSNLLLLFYVSQFTGTTFVSRTQIEAIGDYVTVSANVDNIIISFGRITASGVTIQSSDIENYYGAGIYRRDVTYMEGFVFRGAMPDLGYTSLDQCVNTGFYTFRTADLANITDMPAGFPNTGGFIKVYRKEQGAIWQELSTNNYHAIRYNINTPWYPDEAAIYAEYIGSAGDDDSVEQIKIYTPRTTNKLTGITYYLGRCVDVDKNADIWRIIYCKRDVGGQVRQLTISGEWECALHLADRDDFSGGITHGDEIGTVTLAFVDGTIMQISDLKHRCNELKLVRVSQLYDPDDHATVIADHLVEYVFSLDGLKVNQTVKWKVNANATNCYLAMLPVAKAYSNYEYDNADCTITEYDQNDYSVSIPGATSVTQYNDTYDTFFETSVTTYPTGLTGGDKALIGDNNGRGYNKVYFPVCSSAAITPGTTWKSTTIYRNK